MKKKTGGKLQISLDQTKLVGVTGKGQKLGTEKHSNEKGIGGDVKQTVASK
jgi:hypothetical protein